MVAFIFQFGCAILFVLSPNAKCDLRDIVISILMVGGFICLCL
jgi:hypothetical protein